LTPWVSQMKKKLKLPKIKSKTIRGRIKVLLALGYEGNKIYVRQIDKDMFLWDVVWNGEIYSSYIVINPEKGRKTLTKEQTKIAIDMCYAGACATIDVMMGKELGRKEKENVEIFEKARKKVNNLTN